jgi:riboflavin kinase / FMN adenylyltransferase
MNIQRGFEDASACRTGFVSIGNFDGVHLGHQRMIAALVGHARRASCPSVVLTFDPPPLTLLRPDQTTPRLCTTERKAELLTELGVDCLLVYPTNLRLLNLAPREFFDAILVRELAVKGVVEGPNFCFGKDRAGTADTLREYCTAAGIELEIVEAVTVDGRLVSSSGIRRLIRSGALAEAAGMLGRPYRISGVVARGAARGLNLGFPTANLSECASLLPGEGVYAGLGLVRNQVYSAAIHIGPNPTFADQQQKTEIHLIDYSGGNLYGETLSVDFLDRLRDTMHFNSAEALKEQLSHDVAAARMIVRDDTSGRGQP